MMVTLDGAFEGPNKVTDRHAVDREPNEYAGGLPPLSTPFRSLGSSRSRGDGDAGVRNGGRLRL